MVVESNTRPVEDTSCIDRKFATEGRITRSLPAVETARRAELVRSSGRLPVNHTSSPEGDQARPVKSPQPDDSVVFRPERSSRTIAPATCLPSASRPGTSMRARRWPSGATRTCLNRCWPWILVPTGNSTCPRRTTARSFPPGFQSAAMTSSRSSLGPPPVRDTRRSVPAPGFSNLNAPWGPRRNASSPLDETPSNFASGSPDAWIPRCPVAS